MKYGLCILRTNSTPISVRYTSIPSYRWNSTLAVTSGAYKFPNARLVINGHRRHKRKRDPRESLIEQDLFMDRHAPRGWIILSLSLSRVCVSGVHLLVLTVSHGVPPCAFFRHETSRSSRLTCNGVEINIADDRTPPYEWDARTYYLLEREGSIVRINGSRVTEAV